MVKSYLSLILNDKVLSQAVQPSKVNNVCKDAPELSQACDVQLLTVFDQVQEAETTDESCVVVCAQWVKNVLIFPW